MKNGLLVGILVALAGIFAFANAPAYAQTLPKDLNITSAKADITYETAPRCLGPNYDTPSPVVSCTPFFGPEALLTLNGDTFQVNANVNLTAATDLSDELTTYGMWFMLQPGACDTNISNNYAEPNGNFPLFFDLVPKLAESSNNSKKNPFTIYSFEGPVPDINFLLAFEYNFLFPVLTNVEVQLKVNESDLTQSTLHIEGNTNLCDYSQENPGPVSGPVCLSIDNAGAVSFFSDGFDPYDGGIDSLTQMGETDDDMVSVTVTPDYSTQNISTAFCPVLQNIKIP